MSETVEQVVRELNEFTGQVLTWEALGENGRKFWGVSEDNFARLTHYFRRLAQAKSQSQALGAAR